MIFPGTTIYGLLIEAIDMIAGCHGRHQGAMAQTNGYPRGGA